MDNNNKNNIKNDIDNSIKNRLMKPERHEYK